QDYLFECLQSLSKQTLQNFEVILINDGSVDHSSDIINNFVSSDVRFHVYETTHVGQSRARKIGLDHSKGKYLAFLDSDDVVASQWLATLVDDLISSNADMSAVGFDLLFVKRNGKRKFVQMNTKGSFSIIEGKDVLKAWMSCDAIGG
ncbi:glycosyltransferase family 2 protein, partial [Oenococcus oeni]